MPNCVACPYDDESGDLHIAMDGNFRLFRYWFAGKFVSKRAEVLEFFCPLQTVNDEQFGDSCSHDFLAGKHLPSYEKCDETGLFGGYCARHDIPLKFINMYTGERF
jgi:hypothetical protein